MLLEELDGPPDPDVEAAWLDEVQRRSRELDEGSVKAVPAKVRPWVRDQASGLRIALRCGACEREEFPEDSQLIRLCGACLGVLRDTLAARRATERMLLYRTYSPEARCEHAGDDSVLGVYPWFAEWSEDFPVGLCRVCVANEERRRNAG